MFDLDELSDSNISLVMKAAEAALNAEHRGGPDQITVMVYGGGNLVRLTTLLGQRSAALGVSLGAVYSVLPVAGTVIAFYAVHAMGTYVAVLRGLRPGAPPPDGTSAETFAAHQPGIDLPEPRPDAP